MFWTSIRFSQTDALKRTLESLLTTKKPPPIRSSQPDVKRTLEKLLSGKVPPPSLATPKGNLYEVLSKTASGGVGKHVYQTRWSRKQIPNCYWVVTRTKLKCEGQHGRAWGKMVWRGKEVSGREEQIRGALKYKWAEGHSKADAPAS